MPRSPRSISAPDAVIPVRALDFAMNHTKDMHGTRARTARRGEVRRSPSCLSRFRHALPQATFGHCETLSKPQGGWRETLE